MERFFKLNSFEDCREFNREYILKNLEYMLTTQFDSCAEVDHFNYELLTFAEYFYVNDKEIQDDIKEIKKIIYNNYILKWQKINKLTPKNPYLSEKRFEIKSLNEGSLKAL